MPFYTLVKRDKPVGELEVTTHGQVKNVSPPYETLLGNIFADLVVWCNRKGLELKLVTDAVEQQSIRARLHSPKESQ